MIPREILKKIRQIELRTNRIVSGTADGARLCEPQHTRMACHQNNFGRVPVGEAAAGRRPALRSGARASARFTVRQPAASNPISQLTSIRALKRRERRAPSRSVPASRNPKPLEIERFGNCGEFAIIKSRQGQMRSVLIPSNSMGLENRVVTPSHH